LLTLTPLLGHSLLLSFLGFRPFALLSFRALALQLNLHEPRLFPASGFRPLAPLILHRFAGLPLFALAALDHLALGALAPLDLPVKLGLVDDDGFDRELGCDRRALPPWQPQTERQRDHDGNVQHDRQKHRTFMLTDE